MSVDLEQATVLFSKACDDLDTALAIIGNPQLHDKTGSNLHSAVEKLLKSYLIASEVFGVPTTGKDGHNLVLLFRMIESTDFPRERFEDLAELDAYDSRADYMYVSSSRRSELEPMVKVIEEMKAVVGRKIVTVRSKAP